jgi:hypothetical protein
MESVRNLFLDNAWEEKEPQVFVKTPWKMTITHDPYTCDDGEYCLNLEISILEYNHSTYMYWKKDLTIDGFDTNLFKVMELLFGTRSDRSLEEINSPIDFSKELQIEDGLFDHVLFSCYVEFHSHFDLKDKEIMGKLELAGGIMNGLLNYFKLWVLDNCSTNKG